LQRFRLLDEDHAFVGEVRALEHVPRCSGADGVEDVGALGAGQHHHERVRGRGKDPPRRLAARHAGHADVSNTLTDPAGNAARTTARTMSPLF
jgi:hypothetical protein